MKIIIMLSFLLSLPVFAADTLDDTIDADSVTNVEEFNQQLCVDTHTNKCIPSCSRSGERDCNDTCKAAAADKCSLQAAGLDTSDD